MNDLEPWFRAVVHGARAGRYDEAFQLYYKEIKKEQFSLSTEGSHHADQVCIRSFFGASYSASDSLVSEEATSYLLSCAATNLIYLGQIDAAISPSQQSIDLFLQRSQWREAALAAGPLGSMLIAAGRLSDAIELIDKVQKAVDLSKNIVIEAMASSFKAYIAHLTGDSVQAETLFSQSERVIQQDSPNADVNFPTVSAFYCSYLLDTGKFEVALERAKKTMTWREKGAWQVSVDTTSLYASDLLCLGLAYLVNGDFKHAFGHLDKQVAVLREADEWLYLPAGLCARAQYFFAVSDLANAMKDAEEAINIAKMTGAHYAERSSLIVAIKIALLNGENELARNYLSEARSIRGLDQFRRQEAEIIEIERMLTDAYRS
jgi:tetratricopeptide (TPR) repeat protein